MRSQKSDGGSQMAELKAIGPKALNILRHAIGYDDAGNDRYPNARSMDERRNRFVTGQCSSDWDACQWLCALGYLLPLGPERAMGGDYYFQVTDEGRKVVMQNRPVPMKVSRSQRRYLDFLDADSGLRFGEWLKRLKHRRQT